MIDMPEKYDVATYFTRSNTKYRNYCLGGCRICYEHSKYNPYLMYPPGRLDTTNHTDFINKFAKFLKPA
jgi:hypothetical protein